MNREALLSQSVWTVPPICRLEESFGNTSSKISINTCDVASFVNITGMELMIKANVRLDTHSCFRTKKKNPQDFPQRAAVSNSNKEPEALVCAHASFHALIQLPRGS